MKTLAWKGIIPLLVFVLLMGLTGTALAWQYSQSYTPNTLWGQPNGKAWSPYTGTLNGDVYGPPNPQRWTQPRGSGVAWNVEALNYIRNNGQKVAITFHSFERGPNGENRCSSFDAVADAGTNLPAPKTVLVNWRPPCWNSRYTEIRVRSEDANQIGPFSGYWAGAWFKEVNTTNQQQKISVDTYYGGNENWHQTYCILPGGFTAVVCP